MKRGSTHILRGTVILIGLFVVFLCAFVLPGLIISEATTSDFDFGWVFVGMYVPAVPFFIGLYQSLKILGYIDRDQAFTQYSVDALKNIKYCGYMISGLYMAGMPYVFYLGDKDDAPGIVAAGLVLILASFVVATAAAVFERLFQNAVDIKSENDMTV